MYMQQKYFIEIQQYHTIHIFLVINTFHIKGNNPMLYVYFAFNICAPKNIISLWISIEKQLLCPQFI